MLARARQLLWLTCRLMSWSVTSSTRQYLWPSGLSSWGWGRKKMEGGEGEGEGEAGKGNVP